MGRGAEAQTQNLVDQQLAQQQAVNQQLYQQNQALNGQVAAGYQNLLNNPGYTPAQQAAIQNQTMGSLAGAFAALANSAANRVARTGNSAGYGDMLSDLARQQGQQAASLTQQNQLAFANQSRNDQLSALQGLSGLYGVDSSMLSQAMNVPTGLLNVRQNASRPTGFLSSFASALGQGFGLTAGRLPSILGL